MASTLLGGGRTQSEGPEPGCTSAPRRLRCAPTTPRCSRSGIIKLGRVTFLAGCEYLGDGRVASRASGERYQVRAARVVDARYLSPQIPADTPAPFEVADGAHVVPVNELVRIGGSPSEYVVVGSGKTATDTCIWLLDSGVDPAAICCVTPREP